MPFKILLVTNMYPHPDQPSQGAFVQHQVMALRRFGHHVDVLHILGYRTRWNYLTAAWRVFASTLTTRYDIVHAHYGLSGIPSLFRWRTPLVLTLHGSDALVGRLQPLVSRIAGRLADAVIVVSKKICSVVPGEILPCGVDLEAFQPMGRLEARRKLGLPTDRRLILFPFDPQRRVKRYNLAERAVQLLADDGEKAELLAVHGVPNEKMPCYYNACNAMILCSHSEGSPTSVKEALACNLPVVSVDVGDVAELLDGLPGARICQPTPKALGQGLSEVLEEASDGRFNTRFRVERYDLKQLTRTLLELYSNVSAASRRIRS